MKKTILWEMDIKTAVEFFEERDKRGLKTEKECIKLLAELANKGKMKRVWATNRSKEQAIKDISKENKVLHIKKDHEK